MERAVHRFWNKGSEERDYNAWIVDILDHQMSNSFCLPLEKGTMCTDNQSPGFMGYHLLFIVVIVVIVVVVVVICWKAPSKALHVKQSY